jgi:hypothetical protein
LASSLAIIYPNRAEEKTTQEQQMKEQLKTRQGKQTDQAKPKGQGKPEQQDKPDKKDVREKPEKDPWALTYSRPMSKEDCEAVVAYFSGRPISAPAGPQGQQGSVQDPQRRKKADVLPFRAKGSPKKK